MSALNTHPIYFYIQLLVACLLLVMACTSSIHMHLRCKKMTSSSAPTTLLYITSIINIVASFVCIPIHIGKLAVDFVDMLLASSYLCLLRYFMTFTVVYFSLATLSLLIFYRHQSVNNVTHAGKRRLSGKHVKTYIFVVFVVIFLLNVSMTGAYIFYLENGVFPCQKTNEELYALGMAESVKSVIFTGPLVTIIIRSLSKLRRQVASMVNENRRDAEVNKRLRKCLRKVKVSYMYGGIFLLFWLPFAGIAAASKYFPEDMYNDMYNVGYTVSLGFSACLPLVFIATDKHFSSRKKSSVSTTTSSVQSSF